MLLLRLADLHKVGLLEGFSQGFSQDPMVGSSLVCPSGCLCDECLCDKPLCDDDYASATDIMLWI